MISLNQEKDEFTGFLVNCIKKFTEEEGIPKGIGISFLESKKVIKIHFNITNEINKLDKTCSQFEYRNQYKTEFNIGRANDKGFVYDMRLWTGIRNATKEIELPTVLCCFEIEENNYFALESELELFGRFIVNHFREETMETHQWHIESFANKKLDSIKREIPAQWNEELKTEQLMSAEFFSSLKKEQIEYLNHYILKIIDNTAFCVMRAIDEQTGFEESDIEIKIKGVNAVDLPMIGNGNLSGEYLDWVERFSKYGRFTT